jgi:Dyp-type peroxidase family
MPVDLSAPLAWKTATGDAKVMLGQLQPNILKGHVREHLQVLLVQFGDQAQGRAFLKSVATTMKSARKHLQEAEAFRTARTPGTAYVGVGITFAGYKRLGVPAARVPHNDASTSFKASMRHVTSLGDPPVDRWEAQYRSPIHAVVLIGDQTEAGVAAKRARIDTFFTPKVKLLGVETGLGQHNLRGDGIEHFGYVDGRSQPLFLAEDIATEAKTKWNPAFPLGRVLVPDTAAPRPAQHFGSFFVLRKLEQNVRAFHKAEKDLADALALTGADRARAGAMIVGRFRDGTPLTAHAKAEGEAPPPNDFKYHRTKDNTGQRCPLHGHIRKTNPRGSGGFEDEPGERLHLMARRGQTYGTRTDDPNATDLPLSKRPTGGVGLLFMAFNAELEAQFDFTQSTWANNAGFPAGPAEPGLDQVIGQGTRPKAHCPVTWGGSTNKLVKAAPQAVTMRGGEYFFMPSLAFLKAL